LFAAVMMSAKFISHYLLATETANGITRLKETKGIPIYRLLLEYKDVIKKIFTTPATVRVLILIIVLHIQQTIAVNFFSLYVTQDLSLPESALPWLTVVLRGAIMLAFFLVFQRIKDKLPIYLVMLSGLALYIGAYILLLLTPADVIFPLVVFTAIDACAAALFLPRRDTLVIHNVDPAERARIRALLMALMLGVASPFGFVAGQLSEIDRRIPFIACLGLFIVLGLIVWREGRSKRLENLL